jgi:hypothetical protein
MYGYDKILREPIGWVLLLPALMTAGTVCAQEAPAESAAPPVDGEIIYSRDVHHSVGQVYFPGTAHSTVTAPTSMIVGAIANGLQPLSDTETAQVSALLTAPLAGELMPHDLAQSADAAGTGSHFAIAGETASAIGSTIDRSMDSLSQALEGLSAISGAGQ